MSSPELASAATSVTPSWDLSDLYAGPEDPAISADNERLLQQSIRFEERYQGKILAAAMSATEFRVALDEYEAINRQRARPVTFANLRFTADTADPARGAFLQKMQLAATASSTHLLFFDLEIGAMEEARFHEYLAAPEIAPYRHYLERERRAARHHLSQAEETLAEELSNTGARAWVRLFSEVSSRALFQVDLPEGRQELNQSRVLSLLQDPDRAVRAAAAAAITETLGEKSHTLTFIYNTLLQEKATSDRLRSYDHPEQARDEVNELPSEVVRTVIDVCAANYDVVARYYQLKQRILGLTELTHIDRYAPLQQVVEEIPFDRARTWVLDAFGSFSPRIAETANRFFERSWIDAELRPAKRGGAYCSYVAPDLHPYVFVNYTGQARDVMTLAHELGHAVHGVLGSGHHFLDFYPSLPMAETASVFGEILVFERLQQQLSDPMERLSLLSGKIEDSFATVFRQATMYRFEQAAHHTYREQGELTTEQYSALWQSTMQEMFGDSLTLGEEHATWWMIIPHIYSTPFYVYAYAFGELLVLSLYARYRQEGSSFVARYETLLEGAGSLTPEELLAPLGIDIRDPAFWSGGIDVLRAMVDQAHRLAAEAGVA